MEPERAAKEAAAIANQGARRRTKPPSLVLLDAATEEAMKKEAVLKRGDRGDGARSGGESTADPSTAPRKRVKTEKGGAATRTAAVGAAPLGALLQRERERERAAAAQDNGSGGPEATTTSGARKRAPQQPDHISSRTEIVCQALHAAAAPRLVCAYPHTGRSH